MLLSIKKAKNNIILNSEQTILCQKNYSRKKRYHLKTFQL